MNPKVLKTLEYNKITDMLTENAGSLPGKKLCRALTPSSDIKEINRALSETSDALTDLLTRGQASFSGVTDVTPCLERLRAGASLSAPELLHISSLLSCAGAMTKYFSETADENNNTNDSLNIYYHRLQPLKNISNEINRCIISEDTIADDASSNLKNIRRQIGNMAGKVHEVLNSMIASQSDKLQDNIITQRDGRYCLPVKAEYRSSIKGTIHDRSGTGSTLFIEPESVIRLNNEISALEAEEQKEIDKILSALSTMCAGSIQEIKIDLETLSKLDFIFAKAALSRSMRGSRPVITEDSVINIKKGRHPLINSEKCVPVDIRLGDTFSMLIVTGPNTGGKTVSLKTIGLFSLMGQAGLHIPAFDGSSLRLFDEIYADIGDEQSIEQSLSTFSSHMVNTISILKYADSRSLVLFDELGAGTDPEEGAALAMAILSSLHEKNVMTAATTHFSELKIFALNTPGIENACCEFDVKTLSPTYKLLIGVPGKSNAFAISEKLGLPDEIINRAKENIAQDEKNFDDMISSLEASRVTLDKERKELARKRREISDLEHDLREEKEKVESSRKRILDNANNQASEILSSAKDLADETIRKFTKWSKSNPDIQAMEESRRKIGENIKSRSRTIEKKPEKVNNKIKPGDLVPGTDVHVFSLDADGTVNTKPDKKGELFVNIGILKTKVNIKDLEIIKKKPAPEGKKNTGAGRIGMQKASSVHSEINLIGMTTAEAIPVLEKYLDDAYLANLSQVRVIHGRGTGALREAVHNRLKTMKNVKSFRLGEFGEGDQGVTIVNFR